MRSILIRATILFAMFLSDCNGQDATSHAFNQKARDYFLESVKMTDLRPLNGLNRCLFRKVIENDLDILNDWKTVEIGDQYRLRTYLDPHLSMSFGFVEKIADKSLYFVAFTDLDGWIFNFEEHYYHDTDSTLKIKKKVELVELNNPFIDKLFSDEYFKTTQDTDSFQKKYLQAHHLLTELLPLYAHKEINPGSINSFLEASYISGMMSTYEYEKVSSLIKEPLIKSMMRLHAIDLSGDGYLLLSFMQDTKTQMLRVKTFFIPATNRRSFVSSFDSPRHGYERCVDEP